jgi:hypothetical protein
MKMMPMLSVSVDSVEPYYCTSIYCLWHHLCFLLDGGARVHLLVRALQY